ncbi:MAG: hypothetical protein VKI81_12085 [Synechococcaceae cyanobacterium]|nr:hypothetical protein [Synechococcaceae cyanobacterium]
MANFIESRPAFVQDVSGRETIVYQAADASLLHARHDGDAQVGG